MGDWKDDLSAPARRALESTGIVNVDDLARHTYFEISNLHGIGKNAIAVIEEAMRSSGLAFADEGMSAEVDAYIDSFQGVTREKLLEIRNIVRAVLPKAREKMAYGMPTYHYRENIVHFAGFKNHIGYFPTPSGVVAFENELRDFQSSKGAIQFPLDSPLPKPLIEKIAAFRLKEVLGS